MLMLSPLYAYAQLSGSGYYRVQNRYTGRYLSIVDTRASYEISATAAGNVIADLDALYMLKGFENKVAFNPATICYVQTIGANSCNLEGQGLDFYEQTNLLLNYADRGNGYYWLYGTAKKGTLSATKYLADDSGEEDYGYEKYFCPNLETTKEGREWKIYPVTQDNDRYFGIKPDVKASANNLYWSTLYAGFPFKASAETTKLYTVSDVDYTAGYAIVEEITGIVPKQTPVLVLCSGSTPKENKLTLYAPSATGEVPDNHLVGNYYCNDVTGTHRNVMAYKPANMRMLGVTADGRPAFVKSNISYIPANKCYLPVYSSAPDELLIITADDYKKGSQKTTFSEVINESSVLQNNTINGVYYNLSSSDSYDATENAVVVNSTMTAEQMSEILSAENMEAAITANYKGLIIEVPASYGSITVDVKTMGSHALMVQVGNGTPQQITMSERGKATVYYNTTEYSKVFIYAVETSANAAPARRAMGENSVLLYGYEVKLGSSGIEDVRVADKVNTQEIWYTLDGRRLQSKPTTKGLYIVNGKKVIVK